VQTGGEERWATPYKVVILPLLARLACKRLLIDIDLLLTVTRITADKLLKSIDTGDPKRPCTTKIEGFTDSLRFLVAAHS